ncbi:hypothetical protein LXA43DRAFT_1067786 [Ganoderma leucocontextum]|nr:hypothetical protein LXA43DRAFT_1067786 [Ganoderma leucocontextum]
MAILQNLPPELLHTIFASMEYERPHASLIACSTVSRLWRDIALPYLFSTLKARRRESFADVIFFLSAHAHIAACVKRLWLQRGSSSFARPEVDHDTVHALLAHLPALVNLSFHTVRFVSSRPQGDIGPSGSPPASESSAIRTVPPTDAGVTPKGSAHCNGPYRLHLVILYSCTVPHDPTALFRILSLCDMDTLRATLNELPGTDSAQVDLAALHRPLRVRWLRVAVQKRPAPARTAQHPPPLLEALRRALEPGCVRALDVGCHDWDEVESAGALLRDVGRNLTTLRLSVFWGTGKDIVPERWRSLNLSLCTKLETFEFSFPPFDSILPDRFGTACANIVRLLPVGMRTIVLQLPELMHEAKSDYPRTLGLREIEEAVMEDRRGRFPELTRVVLHFVDYGEDKFEAWATISSRVMPRLGREGLLHAM